VRAAHQQVTLESNDHLWLNLQKLKKAIDSLKRLPANPPQ
jgi:hypothetical protein